jgi:hypothetical protein
MCRDAWHHVHPFEPHGERGWPDSSGNAVNNEITPEMQARARACEPAIRETMKMIADEKRVAGHALAQVAALPSADVRTLNRAQDRASAASLSSRPVPVVDLEGSDEIQCSVCDKPADLDIKIANNFFCCVNHEQEFYLALYDRISRELDVKLEGEDDADVTTLSDAAFPPLPGPGIAPGPLRRKDIPQLFDKNEELRTKLLEMKMWNTSNTKRRKTTAVASAIPKAQFSGPQQPHPPAADDITMEVKLMIANAETEEEVDRAGELAKEFLPPILLPEPAAMEVDELILTKEEEKSIVYLQSQQKGTPTPGAEQVDSPSSVDRHFADEPHPTLLISARGNHPVTGVPANQWECISCKMWYEQCRQDHGPCVQGAPEVCARCSYQLRPGADHICKKCWITVGMIPTMNPQQEDQNDLSIYNDPYEAAVGKGPGLQCIECKQNGAVHLPR